MNLTKISTFDFLKEFKRVHVKINDDFFDKIKNKIIDKYGSLKEYNKILKINYGTLKWEFRKNKYHPFFRILKIIKHINIPKEILFDNILGFYHWGSHDKNYLQIPREINIDKFFVEGYALYLAEGDTGFSGKKKPRKFRFTNSESTVINFMIKWLKTHFPKSYFYVIAINPKGKTFDLEHIETQINCEKVKIREDLYNKIIKYVLCSDKAILIDLILAINDRIKELCKKNKRLAAAYIRGMMIGEGTAYLNRSRYVRIEMRNEREIKYLHKLFKLLGYECEPSLRSNRHNMWSLFIGAKQLKKFAGEIGFGVHKKRQKILEEAARKILFKDDSEDC